MDTRDRNKYFPSTSAFNYLSGYADQLLLALKSIDKKNIENAAEAISMTRFLTGTVFVAGNGGSAAIADHLGCDFSKGCTVHGKQNLKVASLVANTPLLTAIGNDLGYDKTFSYQLELADPTPQDILVLISSSGNSPNIVDACLYAKKRKMTVIGLTGFAGGLLKNLCDISLHVPYENYGIVEDCHQAIMHVLAQYEYIQAKA